MFVKVKTSTKNIHIYKIYIAEHRTQWRPIGVAYVQQWTINQADNDDDVVADCTVGAMALQLAAVQRVAGLIPSRNNSV